MDKTVVEVMAVAIPAMRGAQAKAAKAAAKIGVPAPELVVVERYLTDSGVEMARVEITDSVLCLGGYRFVAKVDHQAGVVTPAPGAPEGTVARLTGLAPTCDHCGTRRERAMTVVVAHEDGTEKRVGRNCLADFLGHPNLSLTALWAAWNFTADVRDGDEWAMGGGGRAGHSALEIIAAACASIRTFGYVKGDAEWGMPTKHMVGNILNRREDDGAPKVTAADVDLANTAATWVRSTQGDGSDFTLRMKQAVAIEADASNYVGTLAFVPEAYRRHLDAEAEKQAKAKVDVESAPCPIGKIVLTGEVVGVSFKDSDWGTTKKLVVRDDRGFKVYVTEPSSICADRGDRVQMNVTVDWVSDTDNTFGFGKRPTKAAMLVEA